MKTFKHLSLTTDDQQIVWLGLDIADKSINLLNRDVLDELEEVCAHINQRIAQQQASALIVFSQKDSSFCHGTDVHQFLNDLSTLQATSIIQRSQALLQDFANLTIPTVALIDGTCVSSGLEFAMMLDYRIASDAAGDRFGFPDVRFGMHPALGGLERSVQLIGSNKALSMIVRGTLMDAQNALKAGLIDQCVPASTLKQTALHFLQHHPHKPLNTRKTLPNKLSRKLSVRYFRHALRHLNPHHHPAPFAVLDLWDKHDGVAEHLRRAEMQSASALLLLPSTQNRMRNFVARKHLHKAIPASPTAERSRQHIHIIGAGTVGRSMADHIQRQGFTVSLQDKQAEALTLAQQHNADIISDPQGKQIPHADVIIEAVTEHIAIKQDVFILAEDAAKPDALLFTVSTSLSLHDISAPMLQPQRLMGLHFFKPFDQVNLIEISTRDLNATAQLQPVAALIRHWGCIPLPTKDAPGRLICRILLAYILQGIRLYQQKVPPRCIDQAGIDFGMPLGPLEMADQMGLDTCWCIGEAIAKPSGIELPYKLGEMVREGKLGMKSGTGFYRYRNGRRLKTEKYDWDGDMPTMQDKLARQMQNEASICLEEGIIDDPAVLDAAMILGAGYPDYQDSLINQ